jgi:hypothetical protein
MKESLAFNDLSVFLFESCMEQTATSPDSPRGLYLHV